MMEFIYCGSVDIPDLEVEEFTKVLESLQIEFHQDVKSDVDLALDMADTDSEDDENSSTAVMSDRDFEDLIDVEQPVWNDVTIKDEPVDEEYLEEPSEEVVRPMDTQINIPDEKRVSQISRVQVFPTRTYIQSKQLIKMPEKISVERVVPNKKLQQFMLDNPAVCPFCNKIFKTPKHRNEHVKYCVTNPHRVVSRCPLCNKSVCDPYYLRKHMRNIHGNGLRQRPN